MLKAVESGKQHPGYLLAGEHQPSLILNIPQKTKNYQRLLCSKTEKLGDGLDYTTDFYLQQQAPCISGHSFKGMIIFLIDHILSHKLHIQQKIKLIAHFF